MEICLKEWPDYAVNEHGLMFSPSLPFNQSHRHFSHLMAIHPLGLIDPANGQKDMEIIDKTIANLDAMVPVNGSAIPLAG